MTPRSFLVLAGLTVTVVLLAILSSAQTGTNAAIAGRGDKLLPGLSASAADQIAAITVSDGARTTTVSRQDKTLVDASSGFPIKPEAARRLVTSLATLTIEETKTSDPQRYGELDLADPGAEDGAGQRVTLKGADGSVIVDVIVGRRDYTVGGTNGGQFIRVAGVPQGYLVRGAVEIPAARSSWFDTNLTRIEENEILNVKAVDDAGQQTFEVARDGEKLNLLSVPENREMDEAKLSRLTRMIAPLSFTDVRKSGDGNGAAGPTMTIKAKNGMAVTIQALQATRSDSGDNWFRVTVDQGAPEAADLAEELSAKLQGFEFALNSSDAAMLWWTTQDLTAEIKQDS